MRGRLLPVWVAGTAVLVLLAGPAVLAGCASSAGTRTSSSRPTSPTPVAPGSAGSVGVVTPAAASASTVAGQVPTVFDCGGGAYEPATLLVICGVAGVNATIATGVRWTSWTATGATGAGNLQLGGRKDWTPARLVLSSAVSTPGGPQFSLLVVTWTGPSPDGNPSDVFHLALGR